MDCPICSNNDENEFTTSSVAFDPKLDYVEWWCARCHAVWIASAHGMLVDVIFEP